MKLVLHNFRCHTDATFEIPDSGLVLLSGASGSGKSTIIKAILYALYGTKAIKKPYSFGTTTCSVKLNYNGLKITRTNKPNRLVVNGSFEDEPAQKIIDQKFGSYEEFIVSSYIPQKNNSSILSLSPMEQLKIIKTLAIDNDSNEFIKEKIKKLLIDVNNNILSCKNELEIATQEITNLKNDISVISFPLNLENNETELECISRYNARIQNFGLQLTENMDKKIELEKQKNDYETTKKQIEELKIQENKYNQELITILNQIDSIKLINYTDKLESLKNALENLEKILELIKLEKQFQEIKQAEEQETQKELVSLEFKLKQYPNSLSVLENTLEANVLIIQHLNMLLEYKNSTITDIKNLDILKQGIELECPNCNCSLKYNDNKLVLCDSAKIIQGLKGLKQVDENETIVKLLDKYSLDIKKIQSDLQNIKSLNMKKQMLLQKTMSVALKQIQNKIQSLKNKITIKYDGNDIIMDYNKKKDELNELEFTKKQIDKYETQKKLLNNSIENIKNKLNIEQGKITKYQSINYEKNINIIDNCIKKLKQENEKDMLKKDNVDKYLINLEKKKNLDRWQYKIQEAEKVYKNMEERYKALLVLKEKYAQAEIIALQSTLETINEHTKYYLDTFFEQGHIIATLQADFKGKIQTLKVNTVINYKGNEYDNVNQLSGGEFDRCTLASICGINSLLQSPILILDESLSSLDSDTNTEIIRFLSDLSIDKLILVCSHEAVKGIFDQVIELH
jgi:DNA repair exonuclease SbcCD ATPase subunit